MCQPVGGTLPAVAKLNAGTVLGLLALVVSCATAAVVGYDHLSRADAGDDVVRIASAAEVEANAKVRLPAGTTLLSAVYRSTGRGLDTFVYARFRFTRAALPQFLADSGLPEPTPGLRALSDKDAPPSGTWHPDAATTISGIQESQPYQHVYRRVLVDLGNPADLTVYLVATQP